MTKLKFESDPMVAVVVMLRLQFNSS